MSVLSYLSIPYFGSGRDLMIERARLAGAAAPHLIIGGRLVLCLVIMNHEVLTQLGEDAGGVPKGYWRELEERLAPACDDLVILAIPGWKRSRGVAREVALFNNAGKPLLWMSGVDVEPVVLPPDHASRVGEGSL